MEDKDINTVIRVIGILGIIFCIVSLVTPWSSSAFTFGVFKQDYSAPFYIDYFTSQTIRESSYYYQALFFSIAMVIIFISIIIALVYGIISVSRVKYEEPTTFLFIGSLFIFNIILYILAVSIWSNNIIHIGTAYSPGFITALISFIIFFILFILKSIFHKEPKPIKKEETENEALKILKIRYAKGEITIEKFEEMKKKIQD